MGRFDMGIQRLLTYSWKMSPSGVTTQLAKLIGSKVFVVIDRSAYVTHHILIFLCYQSAVSFAYWLIFIFALVRFIIVWISVWLCVYSSISVDLNSSQSVDSERTNMKLWSFVKPKLLEPCSLSLPVCLCRAQWKHTEVEEKIIELNRPHFGFESPGRPGPFCVEFACSPCACVGFLWLPPTAQRSAVVNLKWP